jgi:hypothetical protein
MMQRLRGLRFKEVEGVKEVREVREVREVAEVKSLVCFPFFFRALDLFDLLTL